ncbi:hypothetical protein GIX45_07570 [Erwinia sp. CPCC 100877]|nr:hypothetical protein [Erwinia sp. CPCC 100877]
MTEKYTDKTNTTGESAAIAQRRTKSITGRVGIIIDTTPPDVPVIVSASDNVGSLKGQVEQNGVINDPLPTINGTAEANSILTLYVDNVVVGSVKVDGSGNWSVPLTTALVDGEHSFSATARDAAKNLSAKTADWKIIIDTVAETPAITSVIDDVGSIIGTVTNGGLTDDVRPNISGTSEVGSIVTVMIDGKVAGSTTADASGTWSFMPTSDLSEGEHTISAIAEDRAGNLSTQSAEWKITISTALVPPVITSVIDDVGSITGEITMGGLTNDKRPTLNGTAEAGSTVTVYADGKVAGSVKADASGNWSFTPAGDLADGSYSFTARSENSAGYISEPSSAWDIIIDTVTTAPVITSVMDDVEGITGNISSGSKTNDPRPDINGTAEGNSVVTVFIDGKVAGSTTADAAGNWSFTPASNLADGKHSFTATAIDQAGNASGTSPAWDVTVDTQGPTSAPTITSVHDDVGAIQGNVANGGITDDARPTITGTANIDDIVIVYVDGEAVGSTVAQWAGFWPFQYGEWVFTPEIDLADGAHQITAAISDDAGNTGAHTEAWNITIAGTAPEEPIIVSVVDDVDAITGTIASGGLTNDDRPTLNGTAEANGVVKIYVDGSVSGSVKADASGNWSFTPSSALADGQHEFTATVTNAAGSTSKQAAPWTVNVDTIVATPQITSVQDDVGSITGNIANGGVTDDRLPVLNGTADAGSVVTIYINGLEAGSTTASAEGHWSLAAPGNLADGSYSFTAIATDAAGNISGKSPAWNIIIDTGIAVPTIDSVVDDVNAITGNIVNGGLTNDARPTLNGTAEANSIVTVYVDGRASGSVQADAAGNWSFTPSSDLSNGSHSFIVSATDAAGNGSARTPEWNITVDTVAPGTPVITSVVDDVEGITGNISSDSKTNDPRPDINGTAEGNSVVTVYIDGKVAGSTTADAAGNWSFTPASNLADGKHSFTVTAIDQAGNASGTSPAWNVTVDTQGPTSAPTITSVHDDVGAIQGNVANGGITDDARPTITGTANIDDIVIVYVDGEAVGSTATHWAGFWPFQYGEWVFTPEIDLTDGVHQITAVARDDAGNYSVSSAGWSVIVDTTAPELPTITDVYDDVAGIIGSVDNGSLTNDVRPTLSGSAEANSVVTIYIDDKVSGSIKADASGHWRFTPANDLAEGNHSFTVTATDAAGNTSSHSPEWKVLVDASVNAPIITDVVDDAGGVIGSIINGGVTDDRRPEIHGTAEANSVVTIYIDGIQAGSVTANAAGNWNFTAPGNLADGKHSFTASVVDTAGNSSGKSPAWNIIVDTETAVPTINSVTDDVHSITGNIASGGLTNDARPTLKGTAEANSVVTVYVDGNASGTAKVDASGNWSFTPASDLTNGDHSFTASATDVAGNTSAQTPAWNVTVDTVAPDAPSIVSVVDNVAGIIGNIISGGLTNDARPLLNGTAEANSVVTVYVDGNVSGSVKADASGNWSFSPASALADGYHNFTATATDAAGNTSAHTAAWNVNVDTLVATPTITTVMDDVGSITGNISNGGVTDDKRPQINGMAEANSVVTVYIDGRVSGSTTADAGGSWSFTPPSDLTDGTHSVSAAAADLAGNVSVQSPAWNVTVDTVAPNTPIITSVIDDVASLTGNITSGGLTNDTRPTLNGMAEANSVVTVYVNGQISGSSKADASGNWRFTPSNDLPDGSHSFNVSATDVAGNTSEQTPAWIVIVDTTVAAPVLTSVIDDTGSVTGNIANGGLTDDKRPQINGVAEANNVVTVYVDGRVAGSTTASANGDWSFTPSMDLADGSHSIAATATDAAGNTSTQTPAWNITVRTVADAPVIVSVMDDIGPVTGNIVNGGLTDDKRPQINGKAEANSVVTVYVDGQVVGSTLANSSGAWSFTPVTELTEGSHRFTATATDVVGNTSAQSPAWNVTVDTLAPNSPVITSVVDDVNAITGNIANGGLTNDTRPTLNGTAEPNSVLTVYVDGNKAGSTTVSANGTWSFTPSANLANGSHTLTATATDKAGNISEQSPAWTVMVDSVAPNMPVITSGFDDVGSVIGTITNGGVTDDKRPQIQGTAEANSVVTVYVDGHVAGSTTTSYDGTWTFTPATDLTEGLHRFTATATDAAGNTSAQTPAWNVTVDTVITGSVITSVYDDVAEKIGYVSNGGVTNDPRPTINGTAEANSVVQILMGNHLVGSTVANASGKWTYTPTSNLADGLYVISTIAKDLAGNTASSSNSWNITVDTVAPNAPVITSVIDDVGTVTGNIPNGGTTSDDRRPTINGIAEANSTVNVLIDGVVVGSTVVNSNGSWSMTPSYDLADGKHVITANASDLASNHSGMSSAWTINITPPTNTPVSIFEDWETVASKTMDSAGTTFNTKYLSVTALNSTTNTAGNFHTGIINNQAVGLTDKTDGNGLTLGPGGSVNIKLLNNMQATRLKIDAGDLEQYKTNESFSIKFYDATGHLILSQTYQKFEGEGEVPVMWWTSTVDYKTKDTLEFVMPDGKSFASFTVTSVDTAASSWVWVDNLTISGITTYSPVASYSAMVEDISVPDETTLYLLDQDTTDTDTGIAPDSVVAGMQTLEVRDSSVAEDAMSEAQESNMHYNAAERTLMPLHTEQSVDFGQLVQNENLVLRLSDIDATMPVQVVDLAGHGNNVLNINAEDILTHGEKDLFLNDGNAQIMVKGDKGDVINLESLLGNDSQSQWSTQEIVHIEGEQYQVWHDTYNSVELLVQQGVEVDLQNR